MFIFQRVCFSSPSAPDPNQLGRGAELIVQIHRLENPARTVAQQSKWHLETPLECDTTRIFLHNFTMIIDGYQWFFMIVDGY